ncbi:Hypothetical predicted protein [Prunus dulcis]|uniref:Uncharacterized protein n=1 Tax=Prunus dulcis TaxID=3755 RepID=A0A5E4GBL1_PRUDU|nr:Hypothetical predicted protein [Prunus dulcis]
MHNNKSSAKGKSQELRGGLGLKGTFWQMRIRPSSPSYISNFRLSEGQALGEETTTLEGRSSQEGYPKIMCLPWDTCAFHK